MYEPGSFATLTRFNRRGAMLASGCHNGKVVVWDFLTRSKALVLHQHTHPITSLSWSRDNRRLLSSSLDWRIRLWNVETGEAVYTHDLGEPVLNASIHPRRDDLCVVCVPSKVPELINLREYMRKPVPTKEGAQHSLLLGALAFNRDGSMLFWGDSVGQIHVVDVEKWVETQVLSLGDEKIGIKQIVFNRKGTMFLVNSNDRKIRLFDAETLTCLRTFVDPVKKNMWKTCRFSSNSEFVMAGSADKVLSSVFFFFFPFFFVILIHSPFLLRLNITYTSGTENMEILSSRSKGPRREFWIFNGILCNPLFVLVQRAVVSFSFGAPTILNTGLHMHPTLLSCTKTKYIKSEKMSSMFWTKSTWRERRLGKRKQKKLTLILTPLSLLKDSLVKKRAI